MMKRFAAIIACALAAGLASAEPAMTLTAIKGKVEVKPLGKAWTRATEGMRVDKLATISTGFDSTAVLKIDATTIKLDPITRLTVDKIIEKAGATGTTLHLRVGKVTADVKSSAGSAQDFRVTSPYSTASVLGTKFVYDGLSLRVLRGRVRFTPGRPPRVIGLPDPGTGGPGQEQILLYLQADFPADTFLWDGADGGSGFDSGEGPVIGEGQEYGLDDGSGEDAGGSSGGGASRPSGRGTGSVVVTWEE